MAPKSNFDEIYTFLNEKFAGETEYLQAVHEVLEDIVYYYAMMSSRKRAQLRQFARSLAEGD